MATKAQEAAKEPKIVKFPRPKPKPVLQPAILVHTDMVYTSWACRYIMWQWNVLSGSEDQGDYDLAGPPIILMGQTLVSFARTLAVRQFLSSPEPTHLFMCDVDMAWPLDAVGVLMAHDKPVISGRCHMKRHPYPVTAFEWQDDKLRPVSKPPDVGVEEVAAAGTGFMIIAREVLEAVGDDGFLPMRDLGEDLSFCLRAREAGYGIWYDYGVSIRHYSPTPICKETIDGGTRPAS